MSNDTEMAASPINNSFMSEKGMTLRDYFAAKALQAMISRGDEGQWLARDAYAYADAMLAERSK